MAGWIKEKTQKNNLLEEDKYVYVGDPVLGAKFHCLLKVKKEGLGPRFSSIHEFQNRKVQN